MSLSAAVEAVPMPTENPGPVSRDEMLSAVSAIATSDVRGMARVVDRDGVYPEENLIKLGKAGAFSQHLTGYGYNPDSLDLPDAIEAMATVGAECGCTSFLMWLQSAFGWYLLQSENTAVKDELLGSVVACDVIGSSGMSNPVKSMDGIEKFKLRGEKVDGGYVVNGTLPFVSNLGDGHYFGTAFELADDPAHKVMCVLHCNRGGITIKQNAHFVGLEGSGTYTVFAKDAFVPESRILADPLPPFVKKIKPAFFLLQIGMALGQIRGCVEIMKKAGKQLSHVNCYLPDQPEFFEEEVAKRLPHYIELARTPLEESPEFFKAVYQARLEGGELAMRAANAMLMHEGARGYLQGSEADRRFRETVFVAIVTPALKHLRKAIANV